MVAKFTEQRTGDIQTMTLCTRLIAFTLAIILLTGTTTLACGPFTLEAVFVHTVHPVYPLAQFASGRIGVIQPSYARSYLYTAYRYLSGSKFSASEQKAMVDLWKQRLDYSSDDYPADWSKVWLEERKKVPGVQDRGEIDVYRSREKPDEYESYVNCNKDSFAMARLVLVDHIKEYGAESPVLRAWVDAQDQVFSNCGSGSSIPEPLPATADALARQDRAYQIASAYFYSANFDEAKKRFEEIVADTTSPWQMVASYLIARALIRKASLGAPEQKQESLRAAESQLKKILADKNFVELHASATRLSNLVRLRLYPEERLHELARVLTTTKHNDNLKQDLWDYTTLLDQYLEVEEKKAAVAGKGDDLTDWISSLQSPTSIEHSLERWQSTRSDQWLVAALTHADAKHAQASELIGQALKVQPSAPAFASARFHAVRLLMESGKTDEARTIVDQLLKNHKAQFDGSSFNLLISKRMLVSSTLNEFLTYAARVPAAISWNDDGREVAADDETLSAELKDITSQPRFDYDAALAFNQQIPLSVLRTAAKSTTLTEPLRRDLAQAVWLRAVLLGDTKTADEVAPVVGSLIPDLSPLLNAYLSATTPQAKKAAAIYAWLKYPGLEPVVDLGIGRRTPLNQQDLYRDNWWCGAAFPVTKPEDGEEETKVASVASQSTQTPLFLSPMQRADAEREWNARLALGAAPNYISQQVIQWANRTPADPRVPEALHLAVKSTRFGCTDKDTGQWSKAAFDLLHRKYPNTIWAKKTPHWFKD
jgi:tetratricopeptide (TPR) repeat protein